MTVLIAALLLAAPVHARSDARQRRRERRQRASPRLTTDSLTTGTIGRSPAEKRERRFEDCMNIWEPATHMTKRQWRRTCKSQLIEEPNLYASCNAERASLALRALAVGFEALQDARHLFLGQDVGLAHGEHPAILLGQRLDLARQLQRAGSEAPIAIWPWFAIRQALR